MENTQVKRNDTQEFWKNIKSDFSSGENNAFFIAQYTDKFDIGVWNESVSVNEDKLLELRIFDKYKEWKLFRSDLGRVFSCRCQKEKNEDGTERKEGVDYFDEVQLLDIDTKRSAKTLNLMYTTAGGSYYLPQYISDLDRAAIRIRHYFGVDEDSGQAFIKDYRLVSFESAKKRDYSKDLKGENNEL